MAPRRLVSRLSLKQRAAHWPPDNGDFWTKLRFRIIALTPTVLLEYPLDLLLAAMATLTGITMVTGLTTSIVAVALPELVLVLYGAMLLLGAASVAVGLWKARYGTLLASGLRLIAAACLVYAVACLLIVGLTAALSTVISFFIFSALSGWRAFLLRSTYILLKEELNFYRE